MKNEMVLRAVFSTLSVLSMLTLFACTQEPYSARGKWNHMMGYGYGGGFMWLIIVVLIGISIYFVMQASKSKGSAGSIAETPLNILKKRYAKGGMDKAEFDRQKKDLEQ